MNFWKPPHLNMMKRIVYPFISSFIFYFIAASCNGKTGKGQDTIAGSPEELQQKTTELIRSAAESAFAKKGILADSAITIGQPNLTRMLYAKNDYTPIWSAKQTWLPFGDSLFDFIEQSQLYGLFPEDYHAIQLKEIRTKFYIDSLTKNNRKDAALWAKADIMLTDAFVRIVKDLKLGRLPNDSVTLRKDSVLSDEFYLQQLSALQKSGLTRVVQSLEPDQRGYRLLKEGIKAFLATASYRQFTKVPYPEKDKQKFNRLLQKRLYEEGFLSFDSMTADSAQLAAAVKLFQNKKGITVDGRAGEGTIRMLNINDRERFIRIAISMDKYKLLPERMPSKYIWVNAAGNLLELIDGDEVKITSRVICGKPKTRTPVLSSVISSLITYPQWVPPPSIVGKEILPAVKKNPGYLARKGFSLLDKNGDEVDPYSVDWSRYGNNIPYRIVQGSGDANALGIMKFVFDNKYSVYLHDTNQRYLFANAMRSLSHGCVRVQEWEKLAFYILQNESMDAGSGAAKIDSVKTWLKYKQKRSIPIRNKIPVYIRYITCAGQNGNIVFFDDVYGEDKMLRERFFAGK